MPDAAVFSCSCGQVRFESRGAPILVVACHCTSCQRAAAGFAALPGAPRVLNDEAGTPFVMVRKDRVTCVEGQSRLRAHRLSPTAPTRRVLASCCQTPMFLEFNKGHWLSVYRDRYGAAAPPLAMRVMTGDAPPGTTLSGPLPSYRTHSAAFMWRLLKAWAAMGFRVPPSLAVEPAAPMTA